MKIAFFDLETTGVDKKECAIIQIGAIIEINGKVVEEVDICMRPHVGACIQEEALEKIGKTIEDLNNHPYSQQEGFDLFLKILNKYIDPYDKTDKFQMIGYNARFDEDFTRVWFARHNHKFFGSYFWWPSLDISNILAFVFLEERWKFPNFKLGNVLKYLGIEVDDDGKEHDALYDAKAVKILFEKYWLEKV